MRNCLRFLTAVAVPVVLSACGAGTDSDSNSPIITGDGSGFTTSGKTFFNDSDGIKFADALGGSFSDVLAAITGGMGGASSTLASDSSISQRMKRATQSESAACASSGTISNTVTSNDSTGKITAVTMSFNNCLSDGNLSNGSISFAVSGTETNQSVAVDFNQFRSVDGGDTSSIDGVININAVQSGTTFLTTISGTNITMVSAGETVAITNYNLRSEVDDISGATSLEGGSTITTGAGALTMSISPALSVAGNADYPSTGVIAWSHSDGSSLSIDADTGNAATFNYVISDGVSTTSGVSNWSETDIGEFAL